MLILLLSLQTPACCNGIFTTELVLPPATEQPMPSAPVSISTTLPAQAEKPVAKPVTAEAEPILTLAALSLTSEQDSAAPAVNEDIKTDSVVTLATVVDSTFVKISNSGEALDNNNAQWECVEDKSNNLTWEIKKNDGGIRDKDFSYSWLRNINGINDGVSNGGRCKGGVNCDTYSYARAMNEQKLCGYTNWRLPTRKELETLVEYNTTSKGATINETYFPEAVPSWYWTTTENQQRENFAWYVLFRNGIALNDLKERPKHIRLVRDNRTP